MRRIVCLFAAVLFGGANLFAVDVQVELPSSPKPKAGQSPQPQQQATPHGTSTPQSVTNPRATTTPQATNTSPAIPEETPRYRPALLGTGPNSLVNRINTQALMAKGQKDGSLMFCCSVRATGELVSAWAYRQTPDSTLLEDELMRRLNGTAFIPAIYNYKNVPVLFFATLTFSIVKEKPRLRIFANQEAEELKKESDFISPQPFIGKESKFEGLHYPDDTSRVPIQGLVELAMNIDADGNLKELEIVSENPPLIGFRRAAAEDFRVAKFIPAFRDGKPTECRITLPVCYPPE